jgi:hypothetical protein
MPFPLAHPAAVLPLRRFCPGRLSFFALVIGSVVPDVAYCFGPLDVDVFAHTLAGSVVFCLPMGWLLIQVSWGIREPLATLLPNPHREALVPWCRRAREPVGTVTVSLLLGAWTHIFLDGFSHEDGWSVQRFEVLRVWVPVGGGYKAPVYRIIWYALSITGLIWLAGSYLRWLNRAVGAGRLWPLRERRRYGIWVLGLTLPYATIVPFTIHLAEERPLSHGLHLFIHASLGIYLVAVSLSLIVLGYSVRFRANRLRHEP